MSIQKSRCPSKRVTLPSTLPLLCSSPASTQPILFLYCASTLFYPRLCLYSAFSLCLYSIVSSASTFPSNHPPVSPCSASTLLYPLLRLSPLPLLFPPPTLPLLGLYSTLFSAPTLPLLCLYTTLYSDPTLPLLHLLLYPLLYHLLYPLLYPLLSPLLCLLPSSIHYLLYPLLTLLSLAASTKSTRAKFKYEIENVIIILQHATRSISDQIATCACVVRASIPLSAIRADSDWSAATAKMQIIYLPSTFIQSKTIGKCFCEKSWPMNITIYHSRMWILNV